MSLKRITFNQAIKRAGSKAELARIFDVSRQYIGELTNGTATRKKRVYLPDKHEKSFREHFEMPPRFTD